MILAKAVELPFRWFGCYLF